MADAHGSGPCEVKFMWVQVPFPAVLVAAGEIILLLLLCFLEWRSYEKNKEYVED